MFDLYALVMSSLLIISFGLFGYTIKTKLLTNWRLNAYFVGMISYFTIFELISIPSILLHISFKTFKYINLVLAIILFIYSLVIYIKDYLRKNINHKFRFLRRYNKNKLMYQIIFLIIIVFCILFLFFPFTRLRDDDLHWIISIKDNITSNKLLQVYPENGVSIKFFEMYAFNAYTLFFSFVVSIFNINVLAFALVTIRVVWMFIFLFSLKDLIYSLVKPKTWRNSMFLILVTTLILFTNFSNFYEMPFIIAYSGVGQRLAILLLIPFVQIILFSMHKQVTKQDYLLYFMFAIVSIFFATTLILIMLVLVIFIMMILFVNKKLNKIGPLILFSLTGLTLAAATMYIYAKTGPQHMYLVDEFCIKYGCEDYNVKIDNFYSYENLLKWFSNTYFIRFLLPISFVIFSKYTQKEFKYLAWFLIFISLILNPITFAIAKNLHFPIILVDRLNYYFTFVGYLLYFAAIMVIINAINSKSDLVKAFQVVLFIYLSMSTMFVDTIYKRNVNFANAYNFTFYSPNDWDSDKYYPIDKSQVQVLDAMRSAYEGKYFVFATSASALNYRIRLFDSNAQVITPRERERTNLNFKDDWYSCLNSNNYLGIKTLEICKDTVTKNNKTVILIYRGYKNNFTNYVENNFKVMYENNKYILYKNDK